MSHRDFKLGYSTYHWSSVSTDFTLDWALDEIKQLGFHHVELGETPEVYGRASKVGKALRSRDLEVVAIDPSVGLESRNDFLLGEAKKMADWAAELNIRILCVGGGLPAEGQVLTEDHFKILADNLEELCEYVRQYRMEVAFHTHKGSLVETAADTAKLMALTKRTKLCIDTAHLAIVGADPSTVTKAHASRVAHVHLKDWRESVVVKNWWEHFCEPGQGDIGLDFVRFFDTLAEIDYRGWTIVETEFRSSTLESGKLTRSYLQKIKVL